MNKKLLALYGLKWNPFAPDVPVEALHLTPRIESFCWRVEQLAGEGGFALVSGAPGAGKSVALRILAERLAAQRDVKVGVCSRPQAIARWAICSESSSAPTTAGPAPRCCASAGRPTSTPRSRGPCSSSTRRRRCCRPFSPSAPVVLHQARLAHLAHGRARRRRPPHRALAIRRVPPARQPHACAPCARARHRGRARPVSAARAAKGRGREADDA